jgi:hypothetical protein
MLRSTRTMHLEDFNNVSVKFSTKNLNKTVDSDFKPVFPKVEVFHINVPFSQKPSEIET